MPHMIRYQSPILYLQVVVIVTNKSHKRMTLKHYLLQRQLSLNRQLLQRTYRHPPLRVQLGIMNQRVIRRISEYLVLVVSRQKVHVRIDIVMDRMERLMVQYDPLYLPLRLNGQSRY